MAWWIGWFLLRTCRPVSVLEVWGKLVRCFFHTSYTCWRWLIFVPSINKQSKVTNSSFLNEDWGREKIWIALPIPSWLENDGATDQLSVRYCTLRDFQSSFSFLSQKILVNRQMKVAKSIWVISKTTEVMIKRWSDYTPRQFFTLFNGKDNVILVVKCKQVLISKESFDLCYSECAWNSLPKNLYWTEFYFGKTINNHAEN